MSWQPKAYKHLNTKKYRWHLDCWRQDYPELAEAYRIARRKFLKQDNVIGVGIGRAFSERTQGYRRSSKSFGGLCVQIVVREKRPTELVEKDEQIPRYIWVKLKRAKTRRRVSVDVISAPSTVAQQAYRHVWPTAGTFNVGRIFCFDRVRPATTQSGSFGAQEAKVGTAGAMLRTTRGDYAVVSAGHVFVDLCSNSTKTPGGSRRVGIRGSRWFELLPNNLAPDTLANDAWILDGVCMRVPPASLPAAVTWPPLFDRALATRNDIDSAIENDGVGGFVWVERTGGQCAALPLDLQAGLDHFSAQLCRTTGPINYRFIWPYRLMGPLTIGGDSGAAVFLPAIDKPGFCRLLAFHVLYDSRMNRGYAVDADAMFARLFGRDFTRDFQFA